jgi:hypothetical protein
LRRSTYSTPQKEIDAVIELDADSERVLKQIAVSPSGVDCTDLKGSDYVAARLLVERGLVIVHPTGWNGPRFLATTNGRKAREFESEGVGMSPKKLEPESLSLDELWLLHGEISAILSARIRTENTNLRKSLNWNPCLWTNSGYCTEKSAQSCRHGSRPKNTNWKSA